MILEQKLSEIIPKMELRCNPQEVHVYDWTGSRSDQFIPQKCSMPWCSVCEPIRVSKLKGKIRKYLEHNWTQGMSYWIVTRSVRNEPELYTAFNTLRAAQRKWTFSAKNNSTHPFRSAVCWVATTEIKHSLQKGYNVHEHMIWGTLEKRVDFSACHKYWDQAAGFEGAHINVKKVRDLSHAINYVAKYISKGIWGGLSIGRAYLNRSVLKGRNRINCKRGTVPPGGEKFYTYCCSLQATLGRSNCVNEQISGIHPHAL